MSASSSISETAARWYIRMRSSDADDLLHSRFEAWLMASPLHQSEYKSIQQTMDDLSSNDKLKEIADNLEQQSFLSRERRKQRITKSAVSLFSAIAIGFVAMFSFHQYQEWQLKPLVQLASENKIGQITTRNLDDGSKVTLGANSDLQVTFYRHQRHILLKSGEAIFDVAKDVDRPFIVETDAVKVTVMGTKFAVNKLTNLVRISVDHGSVKIESKLSDQSTTITNGQVVEVKSQNAPLKVNRHASDAFEFINGKLVFVAADVYEVADTLSRYRRIPVTATGKSTPNISAVINANDAEQFLQGLKNISPVIVQQQENQTLISSKP